MLLFLFQNHMILERLRAIRASPVGVRRGPRCPLLRHEITALAVEAGFEVVADGPRSLEART